MWISNYVNKLHEKTDTIYMIDSFVIFNVLNPMYWSVVLKPTGLIGEMPRDHIPQVVLKISMYLYPLTFPFIVVIVLNRFKIGSILIKVTKNRHEIPLPTHVVGVCLRSSSRLSASDMAQHCTSPQTMECEKRQ